MNQYAEDLKKSFDNLAANYDSETSTFQHEVAGYVTRKNLLRELPKDRNICVLDSGGGTGDFTLFLHESGYTPDLSDISGQSLEVATGKLETAGYAPRVTCCDSEATPFEDDSFDFIMLNDGVVSYTPAAKPELITEFQEAELELSRRPDCIGMAWACCICAENTGILPAHSY